MTVGTGRFLVRNSILNLSGMVVPLAVGLLAIPFAVKGLGKDGFGVLAIAWVVLGYFGFFDFGLSRATTRFVADVLSKGDVASVPVIFWTALIVSGCLGLVGGAVLFGATPLIVGRLLRIPAGLLPQAGASFRILALSVPLVLCASSLRGVLEASRRFDLANTISIPASILSYAIPALSYPFHWTLPTVVALLVCSQAAVASAYLAVCFRLFPILRSRARLDLASLRKMIAYGGWISVTNVISPVLVYMDRFFIGSFLSMTAVTFYSAPYELVTRLRVFATAICTTLFPEFSSSPEAVREGRLEMLFARAVKYVLLSVGVLVVLLTFAGDVVLRAWLGREFAQQSLSVLRVLALGVLVNSLATLPFNLLQGIGRPDVPAKLHLLELPVYVVLLYVLVRNYGIAGAAVAWTSRVTLDAGLLFYRAVAAYPRIGAMLALARVGRALLMLAVLGGGLLALGPLSLGLMGKAGALAVGLAGAGTYAWYRLADDVERGLALSLWRRRAAGPGAGR